MAAKKVVMIIAPQNFRDEELLEPKEVLENVGVSVVVASKGTDSATGKLGVIVGVENDISEIDISNYDAIVFIGGPGARIYFDDSTALKIVQDAYKKGKVTAAICIAPSILANAGILKGKKATAFPSEETNLRAKGANYTGEAVTQDGRIITANGPGAAIQFGKTILKELI